MPLLAASVLALSCLYVRRMRDAGLPTWLVLLPNLPTLSLAALPLASRLSVSWQDAAMASFLALTFVSWVTGGLLTLARPNGRGAGTAA